MRMNTPKVKQCIVCGRDFLTDQPSLKMCSKECQVIRRKQVQRAYKASPRKTKPMTELIEMAKEADRLGISYGTLVRRKHEID